MPKETKILTLRNVIAQCVEGNYYCSPQGWIVCTHNEGDGTLLDPKSKTTRWTGHNGDRLEAALLDSPVEKMTSIEELIQEQKNRQMFDKGMLYIQQELKEKHVAGSAKAVKGKLSCEFSYVVGRLKVALLKDGWNFEYKYRPNDDKGNGGGFYYSIKQLLS